MRQRGRRAFFRKDWPQAAELLAQVAARDPSDEDAAKKLAAARRSLRLQEDYTAIRELRDEGLWQAVLDALDDLERRAPGYPDTEDLRAWAEGQRDERGQYDLMVALKTGDLKKALDLVEEQLARRPAEREDDLLYDYLNVDEDVVWEVVTGDLPPLIAMLEAIVSPTT